MIKYNVFLFHLVEKNNPEIYGFIILKDIHRFCNQLSILILSLTYFFLLPIKSQFFISSVELALSFL